MDCKELLIKWLNNAYAMENALLEVMQNHAEIAKDGAKADIEHHIDETRNQAERAKREVQRLGGEITDPDPDKKMLIDSMIEMSKESSPDMMVKAAIMDHATEHMEMADYTAIIRLAEECGEQETVDIMKETLKEENEMAEKTKHMLPIILDEFMIEGLNKIEDINTRE